MRARGARFAVVGHVEWVQFARVDHVPRAGEIVHASDAFEEPAGGGAVAAVQLARLAGASMLITALGDDEPARRSLARLSELGVDVRASRRPEPTRRALTLVDAGGERTITTIGARLEPRADEGELPWGELEGMDGVYFTAGDGGALRAARAARTLVASPRAGTALARDVTLDALVLSEGDATERDAATGGREEAPLVVLTEGSEGGRYTLRGGRSGRWDAAPLPGERRDTYGCGDSFAAGLTFALGRGMGTDDALALAARCGAMCATGSGPYERQLSARELQPGEN